MVEKRSPSVQSVKRAVEILKSFNPDKPELGVGELSRRVRLPKSTVFRLLATLEEEGLIAQNSETGLYHLGVELIPLANSVFFFSDLRRIARPHLRKLANSLQETAGLFALVDSEVVHLDQVEYQGRLVMRAGGEGRRVPFHAVSAGKAIVAFLPENEVDQLLSAPLTALTSETITNKKVLRTQLEKVRVRGYATSFDELEKGMHAISTPVFNHEGEVVACVSVSGPSYRLTRAHIKDISQQVIHSANQISREIGHSMGATMKRRSDPVAT